MKKIRMIGVAVAALSWCGFAAEYTLQLGIEPEREVPVFTTGEAVSFIARPALDGKAAENGTVTLTVTSDGGKTLAESTGDKVTATLDEPGFLRCDAVWTVDGQSVATAVAAAGVEPEKIHAAFPEPADFNAFWKAGLRELAQVPEDAKIEAAPELSNDEVDVFRVSFANVHDKRIYGILSVPKAPGTYPAIINVPGAGPAWAEAGSLRYPDAITLFMNVHPYEAQPTITDPAEREKEQDKYYEGKYYPYIGREQANTYFFRNAYLGICRAIDYVRRHPKYDGDSLGVVGSSQGGASALILSGLNPDIKFTVANVPALCDHGAYRSGRRSGWPQVAQNADAAERDDVLRATSYSDAVNFARRIHNPVIVIVGWVDPVCPPGSVYAAFNAIPAAEKKIVPEYTMNHNVRPSYDAAIMAMRQALREHHLKLAQ